ncbi:MAG: gliding motility-associated C-terminal domain-containing protein, partial [Bacteroidales bacterium]|nr:gliding motility-associated C-terminal domain-containing protein [Bacteroidales bacterium]MBN2820639.1 gliding motility-associated C-terminal domain-containing protein [Bacteroidales bacterium]
GTRVEYSLNGGATVSETDNAAPYNFTTGVTVGSPITVSIQVTNTTTGCTSGWGTNATGTANPIPVILASNNGPVCEGSSLQLFGGIDPTIDYEWTGPLSYSSSNQSPIVSSEATPGMAGTYNLIVTDANNCQNSTTTVVVVDVAPTVEAGNDTAICSGDVVQISGASILNGTIDRWRTSGDGNFNDDGIINPIYTPGLVDQSFGSVKLYLDADGTGACGIFTDSLVVTLPAPLQPTIGSPAPFFIGPYTEIEVCLSTNDHQIIQDLGYYLVAPDGETIMTLKKAPMEYNFFGACNFGTDVTDLCFTTELPITDSLDVCSELTPLSGNFAATGDWSILYGKNPSKGGWAVMVKDTAADRGGIDGEIINATITFIDTAIATNQLRTISFESGAIAEPIIEPARTSVIIPRELTVSCYGECDAEAIVNVIGGTSPYITYDWSPLPASGNGADSVFLCAGTYNLTVTDVLGCTGSTSVDVIEPPQILVSEAYYTDSVLCNGDSNGQIVVKATGGTGLISYELLPGNIPSESADSGLFTGLPTGNYTIRAIDGSGCYIDTLFTIGEPLPIILDTVYISDSIYCYNDSTGRIVAEASGGTAPYVYKLEPLNVVNDSGIFVDLPAGDYVVKVTDNNSCDTVISDTIHVFEPTEVSIDLVLIDSIYCNGDLARIRVVVSGGVPNYRVSIDSMVTWMTAVVDTAEFTDLPVGDYDIFIDDYNGCLKSYPRVTLTQPAAIVVDEAYYTDSVNCYGDNTGMIVVKASGGTGLISYELNPGNIPSEDADSGLYTNLVAGNYTVTVSDENACALDTSFVISEPLAITFDTIYISDSIMCAGDTTARLVAVAEGGIAPYVYKLEPLGVVNDSGIFVDLPAGSYQVKVTDARSCDTTISANIDIAEPLALSMDTVIVDSIACFGDFATLRVVPEGGAPNYRVSIDSMDTWLENISDTAEFTGLTEGDYYIFVEDNNGCMFEYPVVSLVEPNEITVTEAYASDTMPCFGETTGFIVLKASGGSGTITYALLPDSIASESPDSALFTNLGAGNYTIRATDGRGCTVDSAFTLIEPDQLVLVSAEITDSIECFGDGGGTITVVASGGTEPYKFMILPTFADTNSTGVFTNLPPASYVIKVTDANGCDTLVSDTLNLASPGLLLIDTIMTTQIVCAGDLSDMAVVPFGGTKPYQVSVDSGLTWLVTDVYDTAFINNLSAGHYNVVIKDSVNCQIFDTTVFIEEPAVALSFDDIAVTNVMGCNDSDNGQLAIDVTGGWGAYTYSLDDITYDTAHVITGLPIGTYDIYVRDSLGCAIVQTATITGPAPLLGMPTVINANVEQPGSITFNPIGGTEPYEYWVDTLFIADTSLRTWESSSIFDDLDAETYFVAVRDSNGCMWEDTLDVDTDVLDIDVVVNNPLCHTSATNVNIVVTVNDGVPPFDFTLTSGGTSFPMGSDPRNPVFDFTIPIGPGTYTISVEDAVGLSFDTTVTVAIPDPIVLTTTVTRKTCQTQDIDGNKTYDGTILATVESGAAGDPLYQLFSINPISGDFLMEEQDTGWFDGLGEYIWYRVVITDTNGCMARDSIFMDSDHKFYPELQDDTTLCKLNKFELKSGTGNYSTNVLWSPDTLFDNPDDLTSTNPVIHVKAPSVVQMILEDGTCRYVDEIEISLYDTVGMHFGVTGGGTVWEPVTNTVFASEGNMIEITLPEEYVVDTLADSYLYEPGTKLLDYSGFSSSADSIYIIYAGAESMAYYGIGVTSDGCVEGDTLFVERRMEVPDTLYNVFTPNGDNNNDYWTIPNAIQYPDIEVEIYDRWGQLIFYRKGYGQDTDSMWDGRSMKNGKYLPVGTYLYIIRLNDGESEPKTGTVTIIR